MPNYRQLVTIGDYATCLPMRLLLEAADKLQKEKDLLPTALLFRQALYGLQINETKWRGLLHLWLMSNYPPDTGMNYAPFELRHRIAPRMRAIHKSLANPRMSFESMLMGFEILQSPVRRMTLSLDRQGHSQLIELGVNVHQPKR